MHTKKTIMSLLVTTFLMSCSNNIPAEEKVITNSPTNPKVNQHQIKSKQKSPMPGDPTYRPIRADFTESIKPPSGSLFDPQRAIGLYQLNVHYKVGDMILVKLEEKTSAKKSLDYKLDKNGRFTLDPVTLNAGPIHVSNNDLNAEYSQEKKFDSSAQSTQKNSLLGDITVYIREILPNGNLVVAGEKWITLNKGEEYLRFSGEIRANDIGIDNSVSSVKVGNRRIEFSGKGEQQKNQESSLLGKLFKILD